MYRIIDDMIITEIDVPGDSYEDHVKAIGIEVDNICDKALAEFREAAYKGSPIAIMEYNIALSNDFAIRNRLKSEFYNQLIEV